MYKALQVYVGPVFVSKYMRGFKDATPFYEKF